MLDHDLRFERLEAKVRQLRFGVVVLTSALTGVLVMAVAPPKPNDLAVGRLTASTIVLEEGERQVELRASGVFLKRGAEQGSLTANSVHLTNAKVDAAMEVTSSAAFVSVATRENLPASAGLRVTSVPGQISSPSVIVADPKQDTSLLPTGLFPVPRK